MILIRIRTQSGGTVPVPAIELHTQVNAESSIIGKHYAAELLLFKGSVTVVLLRGSDADVREASTLLWDMRGDLSSGDDDEVAIREINFFGLKGER